VSAVGEKANADVLVWLGFLLRGEGVNEEVA